MQGRPCVDLSKLPRWRRNMKTLLCIIASAMYATEIVLTEKYLKGVSSVVLTMLLGATIVIFGIPFALYTGHTNGVEVHNPKADSVTSSLKLPTMRQIGILILVSGFSFLADWAHFEALKRHASSAALATFYVLIPVICTAIKGEWPSWKMIAAWILGGVALYLIGDELKE